MPRIPGANSIVDVIASFTLIPASIADRVLKLERDGKPLVLV